jgi:hypothetical protein
MTDVIIRNVTKAEKLQLIGLVKNEHDIWSPTLNRAKFIEAFERIVATMTTANRVFTGNPLFGMPLSLCF